MRNCKGLNTFRYMQFASASILPKNSFRDIVSDTPLRYIQLLRLHEHITIDVVDAADDVFLRFVRTPHGAMLRLLCVCSMYVCMCMVAC